MRPCARAALLALVALLSLPGCAALRGGGRADDADPERAALVAQAPTVDATPASVRAPEVVLGGVVASAHPLASEAGAAVLRAGGTAFDAAVATALALGVVNPHSSGIGGGGFAVYRQTGEAPASLDFREVAPSFFDAQTFSDPERDSAHGPWATGVPGEVAGLAELHALGGALPWADVVEPARALAADGFAVGAYLGRVLQKAGQMVLADPGLRADFAPQGTVLLEGETCVRPALARTLEYIQHHGPRGFYEGPIALSLSGFLAAQGLPWTPEELAGYATRSRAPLTATYRGYGVHVMGPPSSGGIALIQVLGMLERREHASMEYGSGPWTRLLAQALGHAFADRATYGGDPDFVTVPVEELTSATTLDALTAALPARGSVALYDAGLSGVRGDSKAVVPDDGGTTHLSVLDGAGNAVALTSTVNLWFGSGQADPGTGVVLNDEMDDFAARPGVPNAFGLVQSANNAPGAGRRPLSSMSPTLVTDPEGRVILAVGAAGGPRIITSTLQVILAVIDRGEDAEQALARERIHHQWLPRAVYVEEGFPAAGRQLLVDEGFDVQDLPRAGVAQAATVDPATGALSGAGDPRADGDAVIVPPAP